MLSQYAPYTPPFSCVIEIQNISSVRFLLTNLPKQNPPQMGKTNGEYLRKTLISAISKEGHEIYERRLDNLFLQVTFMYSRLLRHDHDSIVGHNICYNNYYLLLYLCSCVYSSLTRLSIHLYTYSYASNWCAPTIHIVTCILSIFLLNSFMFILTLLNIHI